MSRRRRAERLALNAEINVVNLIDVMLLLMVIFMLTAPMMQGGVDVALPRADVRPLDAKRGLIVTITRDEKIMIDEAPVTEAELATSFKALAGDRVEGGVYLRADRGVPYGTVVRVLAIMKNSGAGDVGLVAEPETIR
ncbi:MAG TPA: biopolymer transporter ExbD [Gemmatimonadaceae bacterium]|nr:biopolymer transporter ExbD [Gemmatimonadaceae bacterium]